jgi:hypothetical protein
MRRTFAKKKESFVEENPNNYKNSTNPNSFLPNYRKLIFLEFQTWNQLLLSARVARFFWYNKQKRGKYTK